MNDFSSRDLPPSPDSVSQSTATILIVDDTPNNLRVLSNILRRQGYEVRNAISGSVALMALKSVIPDLILLDINMPEMNGYEVCQRLKENPQTEAIPVIFLSALNESIDKVKAFQVGGVDYITKPFQIEEVLSRISTHLSLHQMRQDLQAAKAEALKALSKEQELNRLKSEFVSMVSHDFRTPLTSVRGFSQLLRYQYDQFSPEDRDRYFDKINDAVENLLHLLDEVLMVGSLESGQFQCQPTLIDLEVFCQKLVDQLMLDQEDRDRLHINCTDIEQPAVLDPVLLRQILTNLILNAIKYSPNGGMITVEAICKNNQAVFRIQDPGIGILPEDLDRLFDSFHRGQNVGAIEGNGLGLAVVKQCVEAHQGAIAVESVSNMDGDSGSSGTTFTVTLTLSPLQSSASTLANVFALSTPSDVANTDSTDSEEKC